MPIGFPTICLRSMLSVLKYPVSTRDEARRCRVRIIRFSSGRVKSGSQMGSFPPVFLFFVPSAINSVIRYLSAALNLPFRGENLLPSSGIYSRYRRIFKPEAPQNLCPALHPVPPLLSPSRFCRNSVKTCRKIAFFLVFSHMKML